MSACKNQSSPQKTMVFSMGDGSKYAKRHQGRSIFSTMNKIWQGLLAAAAGGNEVRIWQARDRNGNTWWHGCDRATGRSTCAATDDEIRAWIDRRYCQ